MLQNQSTHSQSLSYAVKLGNFTAKVVRVFKVMLVLLVSLMPVGRAQSSDWRCGAGVNSDGADSMAIWDRSLSWSTYQLLPPVAVDQLFAPDFANQPLRLSDVAFVPQFEATAFNWLKKASQEPVEIAKITAKADYFDRLPVRIRGGSPNSFLIWQEALLSKGLALLMPETSDDVVRLIAAEDTAISNGLGMWRDDAMHEPHYVVAGASDKTLWGRSNLADVKDAIGRFVVVDAVLVSVEHQEWRSYLNFGQDWRRDFTIAIGSDLRDVLVGSKEALDDWIGRKVRVRGVIENRGGPYIALQNLNWLCVEAQ